MDVEIIDVDFPEGLVCIGFSKTLLEFPVADARLLDSLLTRLAEVPELGEKATVRADFWPSRTLLRELAESPAEVVDSEGKLCLRVGESGGRVISMDDESFVISAPWHLLQIVEESVGALDSAGAPGKEVEFSHPFLYTDGVVEVGEGTVFLPGVVIEGNVVIGENCKIGPNCYIRGNTQIGDSCHVGQGVEIKNSILLDGAKVAHLSYIGDSIVGEHANVGCGTVTANLRHDNKHVMSVVNGELVDTGRRKFGTVIGAGAHLGIQTGIYPGRKIWPGCATAPGEKVDRDVCK